MKTALKRLVFYWIASFTLAVVCYYFLWTIMPGHYVFGSWFRMFLYHWEHPIQFIAIPCFFYGILATLLADKFSKQRVHRQLLLTLLIVTVTVLVSSPFGGMLWHYYDMKAGYFPSNYIRKMVSLGFEWGLEMGWLIIGLSIPYNLIGLITCFFVTKKGSELFKMANSTKKLSI